MPDSQVFRRRLTGWPYPVIDRGEGCYLYDTRGRRYLDGSGGALVVNIGHGVPEIAEAIREQAARVAYVHGTMFASEAMETLAQSIATHAPMEDPLLYLVSGGSEATETAIKLARQIQIQQRQPGRYKIIHRWPGYHGATLGALALSGRPSLRHPFAPMLPPFPYIPAPYPYRCHLRGCGPQCSLECAHALDRAIAEAGSETVAAFIAEPVIGASAGAVVPHPDYYRVVRETCDRHGVLFIADEVMCGMGRTGRWFAIEHWGVEPDILTLGKGICSGYLPAGGLLVKRELVKLLSRGPGFAHGFTFTHHPVTAAACLAVVRYLEKHQLVPRVRKMGEVLQEKLRTLEALPAVGQVRGIGLMAAVELVQDQATRVPYPSSSGIGGRVQAEAFRRGLIIYPSTGCAEDGTGDLLLVGPPFVIEEDQIEFLVATLRGAIEAATP